jgi:hypothetical protein
VSFQERHIGKGSYDVVVFFFFMVFGSMALASLHNVIHSYEGQKTAPLSVIDSVLTFQDNRLAQPPVSLCGAAPSSASLVTAFPMTLCSVVPVEGSKGRAIPTDIIVKSTAMSVVNSRSRATTGSVV